ncbi:F-box domain containing protein [Tanacetum coccineum]
MLLVLVFVEILVTLLVKISVDATPRTWEVQVFTLSTRVWKTVYTGAPFRSCDFSLGQVFVDGVIYLCAFYFDRGSKFNIVISFDLKSEKFGEVCLPERLVHLPMYLDVAKVNDSLGLLEYYDEGEESVCGVWTRKDGTNKPFTKIYTIKVKGKELYGRVLGFRNNGEVVIELDDNYEESSIEVYEPSSGHINGVGINGAQRAYFCARSYMETLLLLDE